MYWEQRANGTEMNWFVHYIFYIVLILILHSLLLPSKCHFRTHPGGLTCPFASLVISPWGGQAQAMLTHPVSWTIPSLWKFGFITPSSAVITGLWLPPLLRFFPSSSWFTASFNSPSPAPNVLPPQTTGIYCPVSEIAILQVCTRFRSSFKYFFLENSSLSVVCPFSLFWKIL